jgi:hypothetical protein
MNCRSNNYLFPVRQRDGPMRNGRTQQRKRQSMIVRESGESEPPHPRFFFSFRARDDDSRREEHHLRGCASRLGSFPTATSRSRGGPDAAEPPPATCPSFPGPGWSIRSCGGRHGVDRSGQAAGRGRSRGVAVGGDAVSPVWPWSSR